MISESKKKEIKKQAKAILDNFAESLGSVKLKKKEFKNLPGGYREESLPSKASPDFKKLMLQNAPNKDEDCIIAEKKW